MTVDPDVRILIKISGELILLSHPQLLLLELIWLSLLWILDLGFIPIEHSFLILRQMNPIIFSHVIAPLHLTNIDLDFSFSYHV
jgi:hypothetical protein